MMSRICRRLCWKVLPVVSSTTASSAGRSGAAPGASIAKMVEAILTDSHEVMSVCAHIDGQYGIEDLYMNVPVRLGKNGVEEVVEFDLNDDELAALGASADSVRAGLANLPE